MPAERVLELAKKGGAKIVDLRFIDMPGLWQYFARLELLPPDALRAPSTDRAHVLRDAPPVFSGFFVNRWSVNEPRSLMFFWPSRVLGYLLCATLLMLLSTIAPPRGWPIWAILLPLFAFSCLAAVLASQMIARLTFPLRWKTEEIEILPHFTKRASKWSFGVFLMSGALVGPQSILLAMLGAPLFR